MKSSSITVPGRFCGPPNSANGGYIAGRLAACIGSSATVTLRRPPPLNTPLAVREDAAGGVELFDRENLLAFAKPGVAVPAEFADTDNAAACAASRRTFAEALHKVPGCFVCGPGRALGDGLRIHVGPLDDGPACWAGPLAAPWIPAAEFAAADGKVRPEFVWAALDCPTAYACSSEHGMPPILLGRQTVTVHRCPDAGERCVVMSRATGQDGRKHYSSAALFGADGSRLADCNAIWIEVSEAQLNAGA